MAGFLLDPDQIDALARYLASTGILQQEEVVLRTAKAGEGNMNCTLRIFTSLRTFICKQSRPWVEKYPHIAAPIERTATEAAFYREVSAAPRITQHIPRVLAFDPAARVLVTEDLGEAHDFTFLYRQNLSDNDRSHLEALVSFLSELHTRFNNPALTTTFPNSAMRALNHKHIFDLPLRSDNGLDLDAWTPGLRAAACSLIDDADFVARVEALGGIYLDPAAGSCLIHGDFFPGSWLCSRESVYVIDPEFCFFGPPEWDLGVMVAHLYLARATRDFVDRLIAQYTRTAQLRTGLTRQFAGVEIMRRLIGVAQLPLNHTLEEKQKLLTLARNLVLEHKQI